MVDKKIGDLTAVSTLEVGAKFEAEDAGGTNPFRYTAKQILEVVNSLSASAGLVLTDRLLNLDDPGVTLSAEYATWQQAFDLINLLASVGAAPGLTHKIPVHDGTSTKEVSVQELFDTINSLAALGAAPGASNRIPLHNGTATKYATTQEFFNAVANLAALAAAPAEADELLVLDSGVAKRMTVAELLDAQRAYGSISVSGGAASQSLTADTWTKVTQFDTLDAFAFGVTESHANDKITLTNPGVYRVSFNAAVTGASGRAHELAVYWNGTRQDRIKTRIQLQTTDPATHHASGLVDATAGSTDVELYVQSLSVGDGSFGLVHGNLTVERIGDT